MLERRGTPPSAPHLPVYSIPWETNLVDPNEAQRGPDRASPELKGLPPSTVPRAILGRWARLCLKELRETLRDRRTIITLVLMPLLVYPLLSLIFNNFVLSSADSLGQINCIIASESDEQMVRLQQLLATGEAILAQRGERTDSRLSSPSDPNPQNADDKRTSRSPSNSPSSSASAASAETPAWLQGTPEPKIVYRIGEQLRAEVAQGNVDVAVRLVATTRASAGAVDSTGNSAGERTRAERSAADAASPNAGLPYRVQLIYRRESALSEAGVRFLQRRLQVFSEEYLLAQLRERGIPATRPIVLSEEAILTQGSRFSLTTIIPLILILMTITGAVYPAIDLTAGERERGTLEMLMAAPVPRMSLLSAKYVAVLVVAMLTATANLVAMTLTLVATGVGTQVFGQSAPPLVLISAVFGLMILFAAFFSAILLALTSFARSFKEAQAYLIPIMLLSLAPGLMTLLPDLQFNVGLAVVPLVNIVLLARDLLEGSADPALALAAIISTALYAVAALALAAHVFGTDAILYGAEVGWSTLWSRPEQVRTAPPLTSTLLCLALLFPLYFLFSNGLQRAVGESMQMRLAMTATVTALLFAGLPVVALRFQHVTLRNGFQLRRVSWFVLIPAVFLGLSLWPFAHELVLLSQMLGLFTLSSSQLEAVQRLLDQWKAISPLWIVLSLAATPAVCEELFFRGYLQGALQGKLRPRTAVLLSALLFGLFHVATTSMLAIERFLPSTFLGLILGWLCYRTASVWPGMLLHATHNGLLLLIAYYRDPLMKQGWGVAEQTHLPATWLIVAAVMVGMAISSLVWLTQAHRSAAATCSR